MRCTAFAALLCVIAPARPLAAQQVNAAIVGHPVRIVMRCEREPSGEATPCPHYWGSVARLGTDSLTMLAEKHEYPFALAGIDSMWVSYRSRGHAGIGALIGAGVGVVAGAIINKLTYPDGVGDEPDIRAATYGATIAGGVLVGGITGALIRSRVWTPVDVRARSASRGTATTFALSLPAPW
jgi:hypothetical protein